MLDSIPNCDIPNAFPPKNYTLMKSGLQDMTGGWCGIVVCAVVIVTNNFKIMRLSDIAK